MCPLDLKWVAEQRVPWLVRDVPILIADGHRLIMRLEMITMMFFPRLGRKNDDSGVHLNSSRHFQVLHSGAGGGELRVPDGGALE